MKWFYVNDIYFTLIILHKSLISKKYKKCSSGKYALLLYVAVSICWIVIRFDFCQVGALKYKYTPFFLVFRKMKKKG